VSLVTHSQGAIPARIWNESLLKLPDVRMIPLRLRRWVQTLRKTMGTKQET
jgi:hypothetical protein